MIGLTALFYGKNVLEMMPGETGLSENRLMSFKFYGVLRTRVWQMGGF